MWQPLGGIYQVSFTVNPQAVVSALFGTTLAFIAIDAVLNVAEFVFGARSLFGLIPFLDLNRERNLPTWFASLQLALAAVLLAHASAAAHARGDRHTWAWKTLTAGFCFLSLDEFTALHERLNPALEPFVGRSGPWGFPWVAAAVPLVVLLALAFGGWLMALPSRTRRQVMLAGALYVGGAVGVESIGGAIYRSMSPGVLYAMITTIEEGLELVGITVFIAALLRLQQEQPARSSPVDHR